LKTLLGEVSDEFKKGADYKDTSSEGKDYTAEEVASLSPKETPP